MNRWSDYIQKLKNNPPRPLLIEALKHVEGRKALDLGAGSMNESRYLKEKGFNVLAVDSALEAKEIADELGIPFVLSSFEDFSYEGSFNIVNAQFSLPFAKESFLLVWDKIRECIAKDGIFVGQFFGINDDWKHLALHSKEDAFSLLDGFEILKFEEEEYDQERKEGVKHWHVFNVIVKNSSKDTPAA